MNKFSLSERHWLEDQVESDAESVSAFLHPLIVNLISDFKEERCLISKRNQIKLERNLIYLRTFRILTQKSENGRNQNDVNVSLSALPC